jgi:hypothetical protein
MADSIGIIWQQGEDLAEKSEHLKALYQFTLAKAQLTLELKNSSNDASRKKLCSDILNKLEKSIAKSTGILKKNPIQTLSLKRGFKRSDIKKAYHKLALQYHPDKNQECDTSEMFTCIQSSYESLIASTVNNSDTTESSKSNAGGRQEGSIHRKESKMESTGVANISTEVLRDTLRHCGFSNIDSMTREELIRKFLALNAHLYRSSGLPSQRAGPDPSHSFPNRGTGFEEDIKSQWSKEMRNEYRKDMDKVKEDKQHSRSNSSQYETKGQTFSFPSTFPNGVNNTSKSTSFTGREEEQSNRKQRADEMRKHRIYDNIRIAIIFIQIYEFHFIKNISYQNIANYSKSKESENAS